MILGVFLGEGGSHNTIYITITIVAWFRTGSFDLHLVHKITLMRPMQDCTENRPIATGSINFTRFCQVKPGKAVAPLQAR